MTKYTGSYGWGGDPESRWQATQPQQQQMPLAIAAGVTAGAALASTAGVAAGVATAIAVSAVIAGTLVAVGLVLTIVGLATGNSKLSKIGGYVGLAGGVVGIGAGLAGSLTSTATSQVGTQVGAEAAKSATAAAAPIVQPAATNTTTSALSSELIAQAGKPAISSAETTIGNQVGQALSPQASGLSSLNQTVAAPPVVATPVADTGGFFSFLETPAFKGALEVGKVVVPGLIKGAYGSELASQNLDLKRQELSLFGERNKFEADNNTATLAQKQQQLDYEQARQTRQDKNANTQGRGILTTQVLTAEDRLKASRDKAAQAALNAKILTGTA